MDVLEYVVALRGAAAASAQVKGLAGSFDELSASQRRAARSSEEAGASSSRLVGGLAKLGAGMAVVAVGIGLEAVKMSTNFNHEMLKIRTDAGASTAELGRMKAGVLDLASSGASMGQGPMALAAGLYHLESLGFRGAKALTALKLASQESAISGANLEDTTSALGAALFTNIKGTGTLQHLMGVLNATVGSGNMRFQQLTEALGTGILPSAKVAGLSLQDVGAALAVLTDSGYQASSGAAQLGTALHFLYNPGTKAQAALHGIHLSATQLAEDMHKPQGLLVALTDFRNHLKGLSDVQRAQVIGAILPGGRGRVLLTELTQLDRLKGKYEQINKISGGFRGSVAAQRKDPQTKLSTAEAGLSAGLIRVGDVLSPLVLPALTALVGLGTKILTWLAALPKAMSGIGHSASGVIRAINQIGSYAHMVFSGTFARDLRAIIHDLLAVAGVIGRTLLGIARTALPSLVRVFKGAFDVIGGIIHFVADLLTLRFGKAFSALGQVFKGGAQFMIGVLGTLTAPIRYLAGFIWSAISGAWNKLLGFLKGVPTTIIGFFSGLGAGLVGAFRGALNWIIGAINTVIRAYNSVASSIPILGGSLTIGTISPIGAPAATPNVTAPQPKTQLPARTGGATPRGVTKNFATGWNHGDIVVKVGEHEFGRVQRRQIVKAMAANQ